MILIDIAQHLRNILSDYRLYLILLVFVHPPTFDCSTYFFLLFNRVVSALHSRVSEEYSKRKYSELNLLSTKWSCLSSVIYLNIIDPSNLHGIISSLCELLTQFRITQNCREGSNVDFALRIFIWVQLNSNFSTPNIITMLVIIINPTEKFCVE